MQTRTLTAVRRSEIRSVIENETVGVYEGIEAEASDEVKCREGHDAENRLFNIINEMYSYAEPVCDIDEDGTPAPALHGVVKLTPEVLQLRSGRGQEQYFQMDPILVGTETGVEIKYMSPIHYWGRETYI